MESKKKRDSQVAKIAEKADIDSMEKCAVEAQNTLVRSTESLAIRSVAGNILEKGVVAGHMQRAAMRAVVHPSMFKAVSNALFKKDKLMAPIATFVSNHVEKESSRIKKEGKFTGSRRKIRELLPSFSISDPSDD